MKRKLFLSEDFEEDVTMDDGKVIADDNLIISNMLSSAIKGEWEAIDLYNGLLGAIEDEEVIDTINDIINEEYVHIGQLEALLQSKVSIASGIDDGREHEDEDELDDVKIPEDEITVETEGLQESVDLGGYVSGVKKNDVDSNKATIVVGLYTSPNNPPERYHYEIDPWFRVYTKVKADRLLSPRLAEIAPFDFMSDVDEYAKSIIDAEDDLKEYEEIDNRVYEQLQKDKWKSGFIMPDEPGGAYRWEK